MVCIFLICTFLTTTEAESVAFAVWMSFDMVAEGVDGWLAGTRADCTGCGIVGCDAVDCGTAVCDAIGCDAIGCRIG